MPGNGIKDKNKLRFYGCFKNELTKILGSQNCLTPWGGDLLGRKTPHDCSLNDVTGVSMLEMDTVGEILFYNESSPCMGDVYVLIESISSFSETR